MWQKRGRKSHAKTRAGLKKKKKEKAFSLQQPLLSTFISICPNILLLNLPWCNLRGFPLVLSLVPGGKNHPQPGQTSFISRGGFRHKQNYPSPRERVWWGVKVLLVLESWTASWNKNQGVWGWSQCQLLSQQLMVTVLTDFPSSALFSSFLPSHGKSPCLRSQSLVFKT